MAKGNVMQRSIEEFLTGWRARAAMNLPVEPLLDYETTAAILGCSHSKVQKLVLAGELPFLKVGNETRIIPADLRAWIQKRRHYAGKSAVENCGDPIGSQVLPTAEATFARPK